MGLSIEQWRSTWQVRQQVTQHKLLAKRHANHWQGKSKTQALLMFQVLAMAATPPAGTSQVPFDTDSAPVGIDNRCSACISHCIEDFIDTPRQSNRVIKGFGGTKISRVQTGTIQWKWEDDNGMVHDQTIPNSYYVPDGGVRLLSPQHWMQATMSKQEKQRHAS